MRARILAVVLSVIVVILFIVHLIIYQGIVIGFLITNPAIITFLKIAVPISTVSFVVASILAAAANTFLTRLIYRVSAVWLGWIAYLFFASFIIIVLAGLFGPSIAFSFLLYSSTIVATCYGVLNANTIRNTDVSIKLSISNDVWKGKKAVFISDLHLGQVHAKQFAVKICEKIKQIGPDIVFIGGDMYDGVKVDVKDVVRPFADLQIPMGIYFVMGNHEEFTDDPKYVDALRSAGVQVLIDEIVEKDGVQIVGVDYRTTTNSESFTKVLDSLHIDKNMPSILLKHTPMHIDIAEQVGISLQLSGHSHKAQMFPFSLLTRFIFKGFDYGLKRLNNMQVYTSSGVGTWGPPVRVGTKSEIVRIHFS
jgi:predicted MPP superfamily phosphohydrolase